MGPENRSVLTFILTVTSLLVLGITSSLGLRLRKELSHSKESKPLINKYLSDLVLLNFMLAVSLQAILVFYSEIVVTINFKVLSLATLLLICSNFIHGLNELLVALNRIKTVGLIGNLEVIVQIIIFLILHYYFDLSLIVSVLLAISISYVLSSVYIIYSLSSAIEFKSIYNPFRLSKVSKILTKDSLGVSLPLVLMDRIDKLLIGFLLPLSELARYSIVLVFFSAFRSLLEAIMRIRYSEHAINLSFSWLMSLKGSALSLISLVCFYPAYQILIRFLLGSEWLISFDIFLMVGIFEALRGIYLIQANNRFAENPDKLNSNDVFTLIFTSLFISTILIFHFGLISVPIGFGFAYFIVLSNQRFRRK
jgi:hypothetical protein